MPCELHNRALEPLGLSDDEELVYRVVVRRAGAPASVTELAEESALSPDQVEAALVSLLNGALVTRFAGEPEPRYGPASPLVALDALIAHRQDELAQAKLAAEHLEEQFRSKATRRHPTELIEVLTGHEHVARRAAQLVRAATTEVRELHAPPYAADPADNQAQLEALGRGVAFRTVYDRGALEEAGVAAAVVAATAAGAQARTHPQVPAKVLVVDGEVALAPLSLADTHVEGALVVHAPPLVAALGTAFDRCWEQAIPLQPADRETAGAEQPEHADDEALVTLLLAGLTVSAIAHRLDVSPSTVGRRIRELMDDLGAGSRIQLGYRLAQARGEITATPPE